MSPSSVLASHIPPKLIVSLVVLGVCGLIWMITAIVNSGKKPVHMGIPMGAPPFCSTCGTPGVWYQTFYNCPRCQKPVGAPPMGMAPQQMGAPQPPGVAPACPRCGGMGRWMPEVGAFGCDNCRQGIPMPQMQQPYNSAPPMGATQPMGGPPPGPPPGPAFGGPPGGADGSGGYGGPQGGGYGGNQGGGGYGGNQGGGGFPPPA